MNLYVTRHGQTEWNVLKKVMGRYDCPLNEKGKEQAQQVKEKISDIEFDLIISSPLLRAKETALIINDRRNIPIVYDERLIERDFGEFEGLATSEFDFSGYWDYHKNEHYESAENIQDFFARIYLFLDDIKGKYSDKNILIVAHAGISIPIFCYFNNNIPEKSLVDAGIALDNCEVKLYKNI